MATWLGRVGGTKVDDMKHCVIPLLRKESSLVIIHAGTNDAPYLTWKILDNLLTLKSFITDKLPNSEVVFSTPTLCTGDGKAALRVSQPTNTFLS